MAKPTLTVVVFTPFLPVRQNRQFLPVVIAEGQLTSYVSQEDADDQADTLALAQLDCLYCNLEVDPQCAEDDSLDQTAGIAANAICTPDATTTLAVSDAIAATLVRVQGSSTGSGDCTYGN